MKTVILFCIALLFACSSSSNASDVETPKPETAWTLIFEENFDDDLSEWNIWESGAFNNEIQLYMASQLKIEAGILTITARREAIEGSTNPFDDSPKSFDYISGRIESKMQFGPSDIDGEREYRFVARIKLAEGDGMWPAFWSYSDPWPTNGEIDILEARGNDPKVFQSNIFYGTEPGIPITHHTDNEKIYDMGVDLTTDFHDYELIWKANSLTIKFDDQVLHTYIADSKNYIASLFNKKQQLVLNLAVGGHFFHDADPESFTDISELNIDWVRVYKR